VKSYPELYDEQTHHGLEEDGQSNTQGWRRYSPSMGPGPIPYLNVDVHNMMEGSLKGYLYIDYDENLILR
jgi:hypothetical protein